MTSAGSRRNRDRAYQRDLQDRGEHCSVDAARLATIGRAVGQQVRVLLSGDAFGLYTASEVHPKDPTPLSAWGAGAGSGSAPATSSAARLDSRSGRVAPGSP